MKYGVNYYDTAWGYHGGHSERVMGKILGRYPRDSNASMEKVGALPTALPRNDEPINTAAGDLIVYQGNQFVIYYDTNVWSLTRIGKIDEISQQELKEILGNRDVTVVLSLPEKSCILSILSRYATPGEGIQTSETSHEFSKLAQYDASHEGCEQEDIGKKSAFAVLAPFH